MPALGNDIGSNPGIFYSFPGNHALGYSFTKHVMKFANDDENVPGYHDLRYAYALSPNFSVGMGIRYYDDGEMGKNQRIFAGNLGLDYRNQVNFTAKDTLQYEIGLFFSNFGEKVVLDEREAFTPGRINLGGLLSYPVYVQKGQELTFSLAYQASKFLLPAIDTSLSTFSGALYSLSDAGSLREELAQIQHNLAIEVGYRFHQDLSLNFRGGGVFQYHDEKGLRYFTGGFGIHYKMFVLDAGLVFGSKNLAFDYSSTLCLGVVKWF